MPRVDRMRYRSTYGDSFSLPPHPVDCQCEDCVAPEEDSPSELATELRQAARDILLCVIGAMILVTLIYGLLEISQRP